MSSIFQKSPFGYTYLVGISNLVNYRFDNVNQTAPVTNGVLHSNIIVPANTFVQDGQIVDIYMAGNIGAHGASSVSLLAQLNSNPLFTATSTALPSAHGFELLMRIIRLNSTQAVMFAKAFINHLIGATAGSLTTTGARNFLNPFGNGFNADNTFQLLCTDAGGTEVITQELTYVSVQ